MKYCEKCKSLSEAETCSVCGNKKLREVAPDDFCVLTECEQTYGEMIKDALQGGGITCVLMPYGNGVRSLFGLRLENYQVLVPYEQYESAEELLNTFVGDPVTSELKEQLLTNFDRWHIADRTAKKIRKKLQLSGDADLLACIQEGVENATRIEDKGIMYSFGTGAHGIAVQTSRGTLWFSSESYEIFI